MSDDTDSNVVHLPTRGSDSGGMPDAPDIGDLFYSEPSGSGLGGVVPPESPEETTMELPPIREPISPGMALREAGMPSPPDSEDAEYEEGEYEQPRSLADRLGDWLEFRLEVARDRHAGEASFREAEIARKAALLEARTAQETATMEQNSRLHTAMMKAKADKAAARGKADADRTRSSSSGMGADKGRSKAGGGGGSARGGGGSSGGRGSGTNGPGTGSGRGSGGGNSPKGTGKGSDRSAGGRNGGPKGNESSGGSRGRQNGSGGSGKGSGSGKSGSGKGSSKGDSGKTPNSSTSSPAAGRTRGRQERAAARQEARQQRRSAAQAADLADRSKDRDQARAHRQAERKERRKAKAEREAAKRKAAASAADGRTTLGAAVAEEAQQRWDKRRADAKDKNAAKADKAGAEKVNLSKDKDKATKGGKGTDGKGDDAAKEAPDSASSARKDGPASDEPGKASKGGDRPSGGSGTGKPKGGRPSDSPFGPEDSTPTAEWPGRPARSPRSADDGEEDIWDAVVVDDPSDPFGAHVTSPASLPRAAEPHSQRPGTTRPTAQEDPVTEVNKTASGQAGLAAKHRTDITFDEYLMEIVNIAIAAGLDKERAEDLAEALGKVADALRDMATDLVGDHNIATEVTNQISDLADAATRMKMQAMRCATECEAASEGAKLAAVAVGRVYGEDIKAMDDGGLAHASAAAHHD
ncbi:ATP/GTP-binding protein [Streptomyces sp. NPDC001698]|uniref:ATP/GTP-binding protein n=1 Tax=Streptomyces sp. NPDC001698 TaxID=3364601 RepID=UPI00369B36AF